MAKKSNNGEGAEKSKKRTVTPGVKHVAKPKQTRSTASRKPTGAFLVKGRVMTADGPLAGVLVRAVDQDRRGENPVGETYTDKNGKYQITYSESQFRRTEKEIGGPDLIVRVYSAEGQIVAHSKRKRNANQEETVNLTVSVSEHVTYQVVGQVASRFSAGVGGLRVLIVDKGVGADVQLAEAVTSADGAYQATFTDAAFSKRGKSNPDFQAQVLAGDKLLGASDVRYNASNNETLNVLLDDKATTALQPEYETLVGALSGHFKGKLGGLKETDDQQDITYLANKTGWDARAVALAALADQFSARTKKKGGTAIAPAFFYALFRAGLPANEDTLYHVAAGTLKAVWEKAAQQGVISKNLMDAIPQTVERFQALSTQKLLTGPALAGASSLKEMLGMSRLNGAQQKRFAELYTAHRDDMPAFWVAIGDELGKDIANRLQVDGKLGFLTINNAPLIQELHKAAGDNGLSDPLQLAQMGYHRDDLWSKLLTADVPVPPEIPGDTPELQRENYASYLAAQVRLSYPTAAVAQMIKSGDLDLNLDVKVKEAIQDQVHSFLTEHQGQFEIGVQPVELYLKRNPQVKVEPETVTQVKRVQRVYQITPSDQAMIGLLKRGVDSAYHVVRYDRETFIKAFKDDLDGPDNAALTYDKSVQVHNVVLNIAISYLTASNAPAIGVHSPAGILDPLPHADDVIAYPTLEGLLGEMDYCDCDHCRSILSPAAYLVDLLQFLGPDKSVWDDFLKDWKSKHALAPYPFVDQAAWGNYTKNWNTLNPGDPVPDTELSPLDVLLSRRPDIQHLPLTCENTNTALPYIDVVNETLEYFIANGLSLIADDIATDRKEYQGHDTGDVASEDLLANSQFVVDAAYTTLRGEFFPAPLPFHQPLESLRRYFNKFEVPLQLAMEQLRKTDDLERDANPYGWRDILMEEIGLSRAEHQILTDSTAVPLWRMYGFPDGTTNDVVIAGLSNAKKFARRVGITYEDLVAILKTRFINPNSDLIPKLERLGVNFAMLAELETNDDLTTDAKFDTLLAALAVPPDPAEYGGDIKGWVKDDDNFDRIMGLITLAIPAGTWEAPKNYTIGDCVRPIAGPSGSTLYYECTISGTSSAEPNWPTVPGKKTDPDGTLVWICRDASSCLSFDNLAFRYSDPATLTPDMGAAEFVRLLRFIRLWNKLGWTIEQTDAAICALYRPDLAPFDANDIDDVSELNTGFLTLLPRLGIVIRVMKALNLTVKRDLLPLLACWLELGTYGNTALYRQMFLNPTLLKQDTVFADNGYGEFLQHVEVPYIHTQPTLESPIVTAASGKIGYNDSTKRLSYAGVQSADIRDDLKSVSGVSADFQQAVDDLYRAQRLAAHAEALRSAFNLSGDEYDRIVAAIGYDADTALTIPNISAIYRRGWLARKLKLSVRELLLLIQLTGLDPFVAPDPTSPAIVRLIELVQTMKDRSFKSEAALYLIWNQDLSGKSAPDPGQVTELARTLRGALAAVETEFAVKDDPDGAIAQARMALVYGVDTAAFFFGLLNDTFVTEVPYSRNQAPLVTKVSYSRGAVSLVSDVPYTHHQATLEPLIVAAAPGLIYNDINKRLSFTGALSTASVNALKAAANNPAIITDSDARKSFQDGVDLLYAENQRVISANLVQPFVDAAPGLIYDDGRKQLSFTGALSTASVNALKGAAATAITDNIARGLFENAVNNLYEENQKVIKSNLEQPIVDAASGRIAYDDFRKRLSYTGVLTDETRDGLKSVQVDGTAVPQSFQDAVEQLYQANQKVIGPFFERYPELQPLYAAYVLDTGHPVSEKHSAFLANILPDLMKRRKAQQALQVIGAVAQADAAFASAILDNKLNDQYVLHATGHIALPALDDLTAVEMPGLSAQFFYSVTIPDPLPSPNLARDAEANLGYSASGNNKLPPNGDTTGDPISGLWNGYLEAPENGLYNFRIEATAGATVTVTLDGKMRDPLQAGNVWNNTDPIELRAGNLYAVSIKVEKVTDTLSVCWETTGRGWQVIPARYLYSASLTGHLRDAYIRFLKAAALAAGLSLTANEIAHFATHADYRINALGQIDVNGQGWLNALPNADNLHLVNPADAAIAQTLNATLLTPLRDLLDYARIKAALAPNDERLLSVIQDPAVILPNGDSLLLTLTRWDAASLTALLNQFGRNIADLSHLEWFVRVYDAFALPRKMGILGSALIAATTNEPTGDTVRDLQSALRARYTTTDWRDVVRPINDELRGLQRDALVAHILHQMRSNIASAHIDTADKLFEYFLMDLQMEACMQTSRIRHALSSVQLFIERCFMNLEPRVSPAALDAKQWEWMKRYRVWEANRKVFLYPENWLEPELRDDKSPFFKEIESELLQSDITEDSATTALLNYLSKLEEVAKLEPCGIYHEEEKKIDHVIARTAGAHRKYYYRRKEATYWTPWEQVKLDIEDNPVIPVVWNDRLLLFWLRILKQGPMEPNIPKHVGQPGEPPPSGRLTDMKLSDIKTDNLKITVQAVLCWSEYYNGKWQPTKTSDVNLPTHLGNYDVATGNPFNRSNLRLSVAKEKDALRVYIRGHGLSNKWELEWASFLLYNTHSLPVREEDDRSDDPAEVRYCDPSAYGDTLETWYYDYSLNIVNINRKILTNQISDSAIPSTQRVWGDPFFYEDSRHVFFVTTTEEPAWIAILFPIYYFVFIPDSKQVVDIPPLVLQSLQSDVHLKLGRMLWRDGGPVGPDPRIIDTRSMERFVTEDAYIRQGLGTIDVVTFGDKKIGPSGAISKISTAKQGGNYV